MDANSKGFDVIDEGHTYDLHNFEGGDPQRISFIKKEVEDGTNLRTVHDGTTNEAVIQVLIHRLEFLNSKVPCRENSLAITKLQEALMWLEERTQRRIRQNVEGTNRP